MSYSVEAENLGKRFILGEREQYLALRDVLAGIPRRLVGRRAKRSESGELWALKDVNFRLEEGEVVGVIGRNGAGKSTLLKVMSRITPPTEGRVTIAGRVGSLLEVGTGFHPELTGRENVYLNGAILGMRKSEIEHRFDDIVDFSGLATFLDTPVKRYSTGMYMRLAFAVAAHLEPEVLLVDEVLAVGDAEFQKRCLVRMRELANTQGRTVVLVSHNMDAIARLCQHSIWLDHGVVRAHGPTGDVVDQYLDEFSIGTPVGDWVEHGESTRPTGDEVRVMRCRYRTTGGDDRLVPGSSVAFDIDLECSEPRAIGAVVVTITTPGGTRLVAAGEESLEQAIELKPGTTSFTVELESLPLAGGSYTAEIVVARPAGSHKARSVFDLVENALELTVHDPAAASGTALVVTRSSLHMNKPDRR